MPQHRRPFYPLAARLLLLMTAAGLGAPAQAATKWDFSGFGSAGGIKTFSDDSTSKSGYPVEDSFDPDWDSILGVQASAMHSSGVGLTAQAVARGRTALGDDPYQPVTEWFFASWSPNDSLRFRAGRLRSPLFMYSGSLEVGNSYPWASPDWNVYSESFSAASYYDGADLTYTEVRQGALVSWQVLAGSSESSLFDIPIKVEQARGANVSVEFESLFFRYAFFSYEYSLEAPLVDVARGLLYGLSDTSPPLGDVADGIDTRHISAKAHEIGIRWEHDAYTVEAEFLYSVPPGEKLDFNYQGAYLSLTKQTGPHSVYGVIGASSADLNNGVLQNLAASKNDIPVGVNPLLDIIRQELASGMDGYTVSVRSLTLGYRYDITDQWDIKFEAQPTWFDEKFSYGAYTTPPDATEKGELYLGRIVTDWVF